MEITRHTFYEELDNIIKAINESSFLAIDGEFTGLDTGESGHPAPFDTPMERYSKIKNGASEFLLVQFGLCAFKADAEKQRYEAKPYSFYVFPKPHDRHSPDRRFLCQSSSIDFLISQGFDFNKLFKEGIPYLTPDQESKARAELERKHEEANKGGNSEGSNSSKKILVPVPEDQKTFLNNLCDKIKEYLEGEDPEPLVIPPCNAFQRKLIYQTVEERFPLVHLETKTGQKKERYMLVNRTKDEEERQKKQMNKQALEKMELDIQVGFSKVIRAIADSGKLVVGHNMFLDVIHAINQFQCPLPDDLEDFKTVVKSVFPRLLDTKLMASTQPFQEYIKYSALDELRLALQSSPFHPAKVVTADGFTRYDDGAGAFHEAGYDAFVTGCCFATMANYLGKLQATPENFTLPSSQLIQPFINKLFLMRIADIPYLNLDGPDLEVSRDHVFHITFPKEWRISDLQSLFQPYGNIQISWLTDTTCYVALYKKENAKIAMKALSQDMGTYHIVSYAFHHRNKNLRWTAASAGTPVSSPITPLGKRKFVQSDGDVPPLKVKRHSLPNESFQPIPEEDESLDHSTGKIDINDTTESNHNISHCSDGHSKEVDPVTEEKEKLFEESDAW
ncbi:unnamed protein product [Lymnaea stagnalis]|uniref:Poly(A)-specific ribonuclease PARN n=1 Tax=Lymnaea stagnalis TaxID=6523 RepID=A0AAV2IMB8_LYMST